MHAPTLLMQTMQRQSQSQSEKNFSSTTPILLQFSFYKLLDTAVKPRYDKRELNIP
ncbi:MAG: hypothetical protein ACD_70C00014G0005 [uncultured bacterium]|nr:MAG: hypothetical protein ACD_70C00014G0005 [uncultured bacterium]